MNSSVFGVATPCLRPSTNVKNRWLIALAMSWLTRTDSCSLTDHQAQRPRLESPRRRPEFGRASPAPGSSFGSADGSTSTGPSAMPSTWPSRICSPSTAISRQPRREQPAVADARGFAPARNANFDVEPIAFLNAGSQERPHQHHRRIAGGEHFVRIRHFAALHFGQQTRPAAASAADRSRCRSSPVTSETASTFT